MAVEPEYPILYLDHEPNDRPERLTGGPSNLRQPPREEQGERLGPKFGRLRDLAHLGRVRMTDATPATAPELVLVFEVATDVEDFYASVRQIPGMEFLLGAPDDEAQAEPYFAPRDEEGEPHGPGIPVTALLVLSNQEAVSEVLRLWRLYGTDDRPRFPRGLGAWRQLFDLLIDVRPWGPSDRLRATGITEDLSDRLSVSNASFRAEIDLWFRAGESSRSRTAFEAVTSVEESGGLVIAESIVEEIAYHSLLAEFPVQVAQAILAQRAEEVPVLNSSAVAFMRPQAQFGAPLSEVVREGQDADDPNDLGENVAGTAVNDSDPLVAVLDGVPQLNHRALAGRVTFDDPDNFSSSYPVRDRQHGTAIVSAVLNGDLSDRSPRSGFTVYVRPILKPHLDFRGRRVEALPVDELPIDLLYRAIVRMKDGPNAVAPSVHIVNLSIGDAAKVFTTSMSPLARLLDFLSWKYGILFIVSAGNHSERIVVDRSDAEWSVMGPDGKRREVLSALSLESLIHRLLSPSEAINVLSVGATHDDASQVLPSGQRLDPLPESGRGVDALPSPLSALGDGFNRSVKPDLCAPGGRLMFSKDPLGAGSQVILRPSHSELVGPGIKVAAAGASGQHEIFQVGTSISAALASSHAARVAADLVRSGDVPTEFVGLATKALLIHGCRWGSGGREVTEAWPAGFRGGPRRAIASRFYGYGVLDGSDPLVGAWNSVTLVNFGLISPGTSRQFSVPVPATLSGLAGSRTLSMTLASWLPSEPTHKAHRAARVYFRPPSLAHGVSRVGADWHSVMNGSVQHEVLQGDSAIPYDQDATIDFAVSCRPVPQNRVDVGPVPFVVLFTLSAEGAVSVFAEVRQALRLRARGRVRALT